MKHDNNNSGATPERYVWRGRDHETVDVGGDLDEARLSTIEERGLALRNTTSRGAYGDGEAPMICERVNDDGHVIAELHVGCGEFCPVLVIIPYDWDSGGLAMNPEVIAHAGRDLLDLVDEVRRLRAGKEKQ